MSRYSTIAFTPAVKALQERFGSRKAYARYDDDVEPAELGDEEAAFIESRNSFYMSTITEDGWPYIQHRGGPRGFLRVLNPRTIAFADFLGNKQYITAGNLQSNDRIALFLMGYPTRERLKIFARGRIMEPDQDPTLFARIALPEYKAKVERAIVLRVEGFSWNCSQHITPRYTIEELEALQALQVSSEDA